MKARAYQTSKIGITAGVLVLLAVLSGPVAEAATVTVHTDGDAYQAGDTIEISLSGENRDDPINVDVHVGLITPDGQVYTLSQGDWSEALGPWISDIHIPTSFSMGRTPFLSFDLPSLIPPIEEAWQLLLRGRPDTPRDAGVRFRREFRLVHD